MKITQVKLKNTNNETMICWVKDRTYVRMRVGLRITLETYDDPNMIWTVEEVYKNEDCFVPHRRWDVGGL